MDEEKKEYSLKDWLKEYGGIVIFAISCAGFYRAGRKQGYKDSMKFLNQALESVNDVLEVRHF